MPEVPAPPVSDADNIRLNDIKKIPCFRNSMLWGLGGGFAGIGIRLILTKGRSSAFSIYNYAFGGFLLTSAARWYFEYTRVCFFSIFFFDLAFFLFRPFCRAEYNEARKQARKLIRDLEEAEQKYKMEQRKLQSDQNKK